ncbi:MAG: Rpn family recombination-promoting nuclease/putative transposase [Magnetococcales bacterium]|nr:Rpn family recombination-promoting nuclease/putative transposase [Magnetococcales bacterium]
MRFLNPKTDFAFKRIFGSTESGEILISFLNAILALEPPRLITAVTILDPYLAPRIKGMKDTYLDVRVRDQSLRDYIIEMQVLNVEGFEKRVLYNACKAYAGQIQKGDRYRELTNVVAITITDFVMFAALPGVINRFMLRADANSDIALEDLELVFAELPKFTQGEEQLDGVVAKWFYFLKHAGDLQAVPKVLASEPAIRKAFELANQAALTPEELDDQDRREVFIYLQRESILYAAERSRAEGHAKGHAEGHEKGLAEGMRQGEAELLLRLLQRRFGPLPVAVQARIRAADAATLEVWSDRVLQASSLEAVFAPVPLP